MQPINTALCSFGMSGWVFHAPFIEANPNFKFYSVWERSKDLARQKYPDVKVVRTLEELLADPAVELVIVNTPSITHYDYAKQSLLAGKHTIVEKPFTATVAQAQELIDLSKKQNKILSVYQNRRYDSDYKTVKKVLDDGLLGAIKEVEIHYDRFNPALSPKAHKEVGGPAVGGLYDLGAHLIDQALQLFGMPAALFADIMTMRPDSKVDDFFEVLLYYPTFRVRLKSSYYVREALPGYVLHGEKGSFIKPKTDVQETLLQAGNKPGLPEWGIEPEKESGLLHTEKDGDIIKAHIPSLQGNYGDYYQGIFQAIRNKAKVPVSAEEGMNVIKIIEAAFKSNAEKRVVEL